MPKLTEGEWQRLLAFKGYGNPAGPFWFIGIEEYGKGTAEELAVRCKYREIEDLLYSQSPAVWGHSPLWEDFDPTKLIPTWSTMIKIMLRLSGHEAWADRESIRGYQVRKFGKRHGDAFLTELLPLPKPSDDYWPDSWPWPSWQEYGCKVLPQRTAMLRELFASHQPRYVFCYGKGYWDWHQKIFPDADFLPILDGKMQMAQFGRSRILLTPFFAWYLMPKRLIDSMANEIERTL